MPESSDRQGARRALLLDLKPTNDDPESWLHRDGSTMSDTELSLLAEVTSDDVSAVAAIIHAQGDADGDGERAHRAVSSIFAEVSAAHDLDPHLTMNEMVGRLGYEDALAFLDRVEVAFRTNGMLLAAEDVAEMILELRVARGGEA